MLQIAIGEDYIMVRSARYLGAHAAALQKPTTTSGWCVLSGVVWEAHVENTTIIDVPDEALELFFQFLQKWR